jgi:mRNA interferase MazF
MRQGEIYWIDLGTPQASKPGFLRPAVIIQNDGINRSRLPTTVICTLSSNLERAKAPGNVLLDPGEGHLPRQSVVMVSQIFTVDESQLEEQIGALSPKRLRQVLDGVRLLIEPD